MAIYEYTCKDCSRDSEILVRGDETPRCSHCGGSRLEKKLSVFAIGTAAAPSSSCDCSAEQKAECGCEPVSSGGGCGCGGRCGGH